MTTEGRIAYTQRMREMTKAIRSILLAEFPHATSVTVTLNGTQDTIRIDHNIGVVDAGFYLDNDDAAKVRQMKDAARRHT